MTISERILKVLKERNLNMSMETEEVDKEVAIIKEQVPQAGIKRER